MRLAGLGIPAADGTSLDCLHVGEGHPRPGGDLPDGDDVAGDRASQCREQTLCDGAARDLRGGLPRAGALDHVADVVEAVQQGSSEVRVAGARHDHPLRGRSAAGRRLHRQHVPPVRGVAVGDEQRQRRSRRPPVTHSSEHTHPVLLDALPVAAAVPALAPAELGVDGGGVDRQTGGTAVEYRRQPGPVRFPSSEVAKSAHGPTLSAARAQAQHERLHARRRTRDGAACGRPVDSLRTACTPYFTIT